VVPVIRFEAVSKTYPDGTVVVDDLHLEAPTGHITVLVGPSGCGKTTLLRMVNRMIEPSSGRIHVDDRDIATLDPAELRRGIGYVIQHAGLFPHRTVLANVMTVPLLVGWDKSKARQRAYELLERVGLTTDHARKYPSQLSGGQQQRVGVARALAADPPVMLMDEPFSAVDPIVRGQLQEEFLRLQNELGKTIIFVTHDIDEAIKLGDQVAVLQAGGHLAQVADPLTLLEQPASDFVADFVGRDRGYRRLGFRSAPGLQLDPEPTVVVAGPDDVTASAAVHRDWVLATDADRRPLAWIEPQTAGRPARLHRGGTVATAGGSLRGLLDAALSSPSGRGVVVDARGAFVGTVRSHTVLDAIESARGDARLDEALGEV
jgi:osmoprotectant transport system ATP-binding protein